MSCRRSPKYFYDVWNVVDWSNGIVWFFTFMYLHRGLIEPPLPAATAITASVGYSNDSERFADYTKAKVLLALNATLQVTKRSCGVATECANFCFGAKTWEVRARLLPTAVPTAVLCLRF